MPTVAINNERELMLRIADGDESAFTDLYNHYYSRLRPFVFKFTQDPEETEEILQETFVRVWLNRDRILEVENLHSWIFTIASRICLTWIRKSLNKQKKHEAYGKKQESIVTHTPEDNLHLTEITRLVNIAVSKMPNQRRKIYRMSREEGMKPAEIAESLSLSVNTVKNVLVTSLKDIRNYLNDAGHPVSLILIFHIFFK